MTKLFKHIDDGTEGGRDTSNTTSNYKVSHVSTPSDKPFIESLQAIIFDAAADYANNGSRNFYDDAEAILKLISELIDSQPEAGFGVPKVGTKDHAKGTFTKHISSELLKQELGIKAFKQVLVDGGRSDSLSAGYMTGEFWYERFERALTEVQIPWGDNGVLQRQVLGAAKKASGL